MLTKANPLFTIPQQQALREWNGILASLNSEIIANIPPQQIAGNRLVTFQLFKVGHSQAALVALADAFKATRGHWANGEPPAQSIPLILNHMNDTLLNSMSGIEYYRSNTAKWEATSRSVAQPRGRQAANAFCLVLPDRKAVARGMCSSCYAKAWKLNLLHLPLGKWLATLLKRRKLRGNGTVLIMLRLRAMWTGFVLSACRSWGSWKGF